MVSLKEQLGRQALFHWRLEATLLLHRILAPAVRQLVVSR